MRIDFIVLACSQKNKGRCVAGIDKTNKKLIRLISEDSSSGYAIPYNECYINYEELVPLDIISIEIKSKAPIIGAQSENYYVEFPLIRKYLGKATIDDIKPYVSKKNYPFGNTYEFLYKKQYEQLTDSLCLIRVYDFKIDSFPNKEDELKTKAKFDVYSFKRERIHLKGYSITDRQYYLKDGTNKSGCKNLQKAYLLISVSDKNDSDRYYKFVAGVIDGAEKIDFFADINK